jgi:hypothetical protein
MRIAVKTASGFVAEIPNVEATQTVAELKAMVEQATGIRSFDQRLISFFCRPLTDEQTMEECSLQEGCMISVARAVRGGGKNSSKRKPKAAANNARRKSKKKPSKKAMKSFAKMSGRKTAKKKRSKEVSG